MSGQLGEQAGSQEFRGEAVAGALRTLAVIFAVLLLGIGGCWTSGVSNDSSLGWDESHHAGAPAAAMALQLRAGHPISAAQVAVECQQYPFVYPAYLASVQTVFGVSERTARRSSRALWVLGLVGIALCGVTLGRCLRPEPDGALPVALLAAMVALGSPIALAFSGTLFLEVPFLTASAFAFWAWLRRDGELSGWRCYRRELLAGALIAIAFFTKFNYGLLLGLGLFADLVCEALGSLRGGRLPRFAVRTAVLSVLPLLSFAWWFGLPLPGGLDLAESHREAFLAFLSGNQEQAFRPLSLRVWDVGTYLFNGPLIASLVLLGVLGSIFSLRNAAVRATWLLLLATTVPVWTHPFHLERFLLPSLLPLALLWSVPAAWFLKARPLPRLADRTAASEAGRFARTALVPLALALVIGASPGLARPFANALGIRKEATEDQPGNAGYIDDLHDQRMDLSAGRALPTAGLERAASDAFLDAIVAELAPGERVGWLGITSELSPAALHLGLLERTGDAERFLAEAQLQRPDGQPHMVVTFLSADPGWSSERLREWAGQFDVVLTTAPTDWKGRRHRDFIDRYRGFLFETGTWGYEKLAVVPVARPLRDPTQVELFACRPKPVASEVPR